MKNLLNNFFIGLVKMIQNIKSFCIGSFKIIGYLWCGLAAIIVAVYLYFWAEFAYKKAFPPTEYRVVCTNRTHTIGSYTYNNDIDFILVDKPRLVSGGIIVAGIGGESFYEGVCSYWVLN